MVGRTEAEILTITCLSLRSVRSILDAHYLHRDAALAESAIDNLEKGTNYHIYLSTDPEPDRRRSAHQKASLICASPRRPLDRIAINFMRPDRLTNRQKKLLVGNWSVPAPRLQGKGNEILSHVQRQVFRNHHQRDAHSGQSLRKKRPLPFERGLSRTTRANANAAMWFSPPVDSYLTARCNSTIRGWWRLSWSALFSALRSYSSAPFNQKPAL